jgi:hypothetical protein
MTILKNLFHSGKHNEGMTSLNLDGAKPQSLPENSSSASRKQVDPKLLATSVPEITQRAKAMMEAGKRPQSLFLPVDTAVSGLISFRTTNPDHNVLPIFTSGHSAIDYLKTSKIPSSGVHMFPFESLHTYIDQWRNAKIDTFVFDRCPRCPEFLSLPLNDSTEGQFLTFWALHRATRNFQSERLIRAYLNAYKTNYDNNTSAAPAGEMRGFLETLRDHIDCNIPYVHWLIAIHAGVEGEHEARAASVQTLEAFGPSFIGKVPPDEPFQPDEPFELESWTKSVSEAQLGLLSTFGMLPLSPQSPTQVTETIVN